MNMKKVLAVILAMSVMLTIFVLPAAAVDEVESENDSSVVVHYYNVNGWENPYIYYYSSGSNPVQWPGDAMTAEGSGWYGYVISGMDSARVIFSNNGSNQTPGQNEPGYEVSGEKWFVGDTQYSSEPEGLKVHFYNYNNWSSVKIYYYDATGEAEYAWPGAGMSADGDGWYSATLFGYNSARVIFNNGSGVQIPGAGEAGLVAD